MSFGAAIESFWKNYANFKGRARRSEYWFANLFLFLSSFVILVIASLEPNSLGVFYALWVVAALVPSISLTVRRLHDTNVSGWAILITLIPLAGLVIFVLSLMEGTPGPNKYGNPVK